jgi:hypothetical protein
VEGFTSAFTVGAALMILGAVLAAFLLRRRDVQHVDVTDAMAVAAGVSPRGLKAARAGPGGGTVGP